MMLIVMSFLFVVFLILMVFFLFKFENEFVMNFYGVVFFDWYFENYCEVIDLMLFVRYLSNFLFICIGSVVGLLLFCLMVVYVFV